MIFTPEHCELILQGKKTMTRRLVKEGDHYHLMIGDSIWAVDDGNDRLKYGTGRTYAVQPGRTAKGIGRVRITNIRRERLQNIGMEDIIAEGVILNLFTSGDWNDLSRMYTDRWIALWNSINKRKGTRWESDPEVWVLSFELVTSEVKG
jgi:hypothetical protein